MKSKLFHKYECLKCNNFKTYSIIKFAKHIKKEHNSKLTKNDWKFAIKWHWSVQCLRYVLAYPLAIIVLIMWGITYPFWCLHNFFDSFC